MSVKTWKKIITIFVAALILILIFLTLFFGIRLFGYAKVLASPTTVDLSEYGYTDAQDAEKLLKYFKDTGAEETISYQSEYENLNIDNDFSFAVNDDKKICYLTFDDGPNKDVTPEVLDILKEYDVKATFFVVYKDGEAERRLYKRIVDEGHTIGVHTASHNYTQIYASVEAYLKDFNKISNHIEELTGVKPEIFRFPGGSINTYNKSNYQRIISEMLRRGYVYYDWNYSSGDAAGPNVSEKEIIENVLSGSDSDPRKIVLCHDGPGHQSTADALPEIIEGLKAKGYTFEALDNSIPPVCFGY